ncbi:MAG: fimbrillin family protein [Rikenellaceae bacterium]
MKKILFLLASVAMLSSCDELTQNEDVVTTEPTPSTTELSFTSSINAVTKVTDTNFESGDVISVTAYDASSTLIKDAAQYTHNGSLFMSDDPIIYSADDVTYSFYAVYPAVSSLQTSLDFYAEADQSADGAFTASDMLFASIASSDSIPQLSFDHKMSSIVISIAGDDSGSIEFYAKTGLRYGIKTGSVSAIGDSVTVIPASNGTASCKVILAPQAVASGTTLATYTVSGLVYDWVLDADFEMTSGKQYVFNWSLADREVTLDSVINGWDVVDGGTIESK